MASLDQLTLDRIQLLHPKLRAEADHIYREQIFPALNGRASCRFSFTYRSVEEQNALYEQGRTSLHDSHGAKLSIVTNAKGGQSYHNYGLALDIVLVVNGNEVWDTITDYEGDGTPTWTKIVNIFKTQNQGWEWGGDWTSFKDLPHFQKRFGHKWEDLLIQYQKKNFIPGTSYVNF